MRYGELRKVLNRNAVVLALEYLAGDVTEGCVALIGPEAGAKAIAKAARRSPVLVSRVLAGLEAEGLIRRLDGRDKLGEYAIVLMDRPGAKAYYREHLADFRKPARRQRKGG